MEILVTIISICKYPVEVWEYLTDVPVNFQAPTHGVNDTVVSVKDQIAIIYRVLFDQDVTGVSIGS